MQKGFVYLVGAGPGDPKLITLRGLECISKADVIVYDRLASPKLLTYARKDAELIFAGKEPDKHTFRQQEINALLVEKALAGKIVTRLKGGDPFVFGRGGEEAEALVEHGIGFEIVPGITSAIAVPAYAGIPVTHRELSASLAIITGNEDPEKGNSQIRWEHLATGAGTLVILMGMANLPLIVEKLIEHGRSPETPVAIIRWGTRPEQITVTATLADIVEKARAAGVKHPATIVVGEVVTMRDKLRWYEAKPLFGQRIVVTRAREQASSLTSKLEELGAEVWEFPAIEITDPLDFGPLDQAINELQSYNYIIFTSVNGVERFFRRLWQQGKDVRELAGIEICAIGPKTRDEIERRGIRCSFIPEEYRAEAIVEVLKQTDLAGKRVLLPRADIARKVLPEELRKLGAEVTEVDAYRTVAGSGDKALLRRLLQEKTISWVTFTSSSTVKNFIKLLGEDYQELLQAVKLASIGPITSQTARELGLTLTVEAREYTIDGLVTAIVESMV
ncbi:uroporphyrinogen-III C-methyltransferase [Carboxydocella sp. ULO1]|uniref:uroporphyrinogen-III C-methyltransferase n=1 Tax=Carboxydocella sp. ULO1 TaxID=1926599 RepID=UPI0009AE8332|nr:uroporphyrinogen-III C-methyltransferase [Carboxydocella sp. ULO1]GAW29975.1 uroporphyrin-III C-methyltransferase [Carboxydocella sp. ULO1]